MSGHSTSEPGGSEVVTIADIPEAEMLAAFRKLRPEARAVVMDFVHRSLEGVPFEVNVTQLQLDIEQLTG